MLISVPCEKKTKCGSVSQVKQYYHTQIQDEVRLWLPRCNRPCKDRMVQNTFLLGYLCGPVIKWAFGRQCQKVVSRGREDTRVWYRETMFSQMVSYEFLFHGALHGYFLYLVCAPPEKPTRRCEPEEGYLRCSKRFDHGSHSIIFLLFEFKSVR